MNLQSGDLIVSVHPLMQTWALVVAAIDSASDGEFVWDVVPDRAAHRITAVMNYRRSLRLPRRLLLEINFFAVEENRTRLELHYTIAPMINIKRPTELLEKALQAISAQVDPDKSLPVPVGQLTKSSESGPLLRGIEYALVGNVILFLLRAIGGAGNPISFLANAIINLELGLAVPAVVLFMITASIKSSEDKESTLARGEIAPVSRGRQVLAGIGMVVAGIVVFITVLPIILFGLCIGAMYFAGAH